MGQLFSAPYDSNLLEYIASNKSGVMQKIERHDPEILNHKYRKNNERINNKTSSNEKHNLENISVSTVHYDHKEKENIGQDLQNNNYEHINEKILIDNSYQENANTMPLMKNKNLVDNRTSNGHNTDVSNNVYQISHDHSNQIPVSNKTLYSDNKGMNINKTREIDHFIHRDKDLDSMIKRKQNKNDKFIHNDLQHFDRLNKISVINPLKKVIYLHTEAEKPEFTNSYNFYEEPVSFDPYYLQKQQHFNDLEKSLNLVNAQVKNELNHSSNYKEPIIIDKKNSSKNVSHIQEKSPEKKDENSSNSKNDNIKKTKIEPKKEIHFYYKNPGIKKHKRSNKNQIEQDSDFRFNSNDANEFHFRKKLVDDALKKASEMSEQDSKANKKCILTINPHSKKK